MASPPQDGGGVSAWVSRITGKSPCKTCGKMRFLSLNLSFLGQKARKSDGFCSSCFALVFLAKICKLQMIKMITFGTVSKLFAFTPLGGGEGVWFFSGSMPAVTSPETGPRGRNLPFLFKFPGICLWCAKTALFSAVKIGRKPCRQNDLKNGPCFRLSGCGGAPSSTANSWAQAARCAEFRNRGWR